MKEIKSRLDDVLIIHNLHLPQSVFGFRNSGHPKMFTTQEIVDKIHDMFLADPRIKLPEIEEAVSKTGS